MKGRQIRVMVVDDQRLLRESLEQVLALERDFVVTAGAENGQEAVHTAVTSRPDVILMDVKMPGMDGIRATRLIKDRLPSCRVLMMTVLEEQEYVHQAIIAGADGYLLKEVGRGEIVQAIRHVCRGESVLDPALLGEVIRRYRRVQSPQPKAAEQSHGLTAREVEVLRLVAQGHSNSEIAESLQIALGTVKAHLHRSFQKIGVRDRTQAALFVIHSAL